MRAGRGRRRGEGPALSAPPRPSVAFVPPFSFSVAGSHVSPIPRRSRAPGRLPEPYAGDRRQATEGGVVRSGGGEDQQEGAGHVHADAVLAAAAPPHPDQRGGLDDRRGGVRRRGRKRNPLSAPRTAYLVGQLSRDGDPNTHLHLCQRSASRTLPRPPFLCLRRRPLAEEMPAGRRPRRATCRSRCLSWPSFSSTCSSSSALLPLSRSSSSCSGASRP